MKKKIDIEGFDGEGWLYSQKVKEHFYHPRNVMTDEMKEKDFDVVGEIGSPACGDVMKVWLKIDPKTKKITACKWRTFGCASAIASTSILSEMVKGMTIDEAQTITAKKIVKALGGLPTRKIHCSVLGDQALKVALARYRNRQFIS